MGKMSCWGGDNTMENKNYSEKLDEILSVFSNKDKKLSKEERKRYSLDYQKIWLAFAKENDFKEQTIDYLYQSKKVSENNLLFAYIDEYRISSEELMKILKSLLSKKKYKDRWFDISLEALSICLNKKTWEAEYIKPFVNYLPHFLNRKKHGKSVTKYMLEILHEEVDLTLIDSRSGSALTEEFCKSISGCLKDINENTLNENALQNYKKLNEYVASVLPEKSVPSAVVLNNKDEITKQEKVRNSNVDKVKPENECKPIQTKSSDDSSNFINRLNEEMQIKEFYMVENERLKKQMEFNKQELVLRDKRIKDLEEYIDVIKSESQYALQGSLNSIGLKLKREYTKFSEYLEAKASGKETLIEEDLKYLEYLLDRVFIVLKRNGVNIK